MNHYQNELDEIASKMQLPDCTSSIRGEGFARFVFVEHKNRAIEASKTQNGWWVEFWLGDEAVREHTYPSSDDVIQAALEWL